MLYGDDDPKPLFSELDAPIDRLFRLHYERVFYTYNPEVRQRFEGIVDAHTVDGPDDEEDEPPTGTFSDVFDSPTAVGEPEPAPEVIEEETLLEVRFSG